MIEREPSITARIKEFLRVGHGEGFSPWYIANLLKIKRSTAKATLHRLRTRGEISYHRRGRSRDIWGYYSWSEELQERNRIEQLDSGPEIHNFKIYIQRPLVQVGEALYQKIGTELIREITDRIHPEVQQKRSSTYLYYELSPARKLTIGIHEKGSIEVWLKCGENPLALRDFSLYLKWLEMLFGPCWQYSDPRIQQIEFNRDYQGINVNGFSNITVQNAEKELLQIYNKENSLRREKRFFTDISPKHLADEFQKINIEADSFVAAAHTGELRTEILGLKTQIQTLAKENGDLKGQIQELTGVLTDFVTTFRNPIPADVGTGPPAGYG